MNFLYLKFTQKNKKIVKATRFILPYKTIMTPNILINKWKQTAHSSHADAIVYRKVQGFNKGCRAWI